ncbi:MAG: DUF1552 domain-containing protein [Myxococcota bacterium]
MIRRNFLRGMLGGSAVCVALPWLESTASATGGFPQRFVTWMWANGNRPERWTPMGEGSEWLLSDELMPLMPVKDKVSIVTGLSVLYPNNVPHWSGIGGMLTGAEVGGDDEDWVVHAPTLDQLVAAEVGNGTIYRSLQVGIDTEECFSWNGPNAQNPAEKDPFALYERLFGPTFVEPGSGGLVDPSLGYRRSALDAVMADITRLQNRVGAADRERLEQHLTGVRELELRLARLQDDPPDYEACVRPDSPFPEYPDIDGRPQLIARNAAQNELVAMALACDLTRVVTVQFAKPVGNTLYPDASDGHHNQTHNEPGGQPEVHAITTFCIERFSELVQRLDAIPEGDGTLLDHSICLATTDVSEGRTHSLDEMPVIVAGSGCGNLVMGQHLRYNRLNSNHLGLTLLRGMGLVQGSWGEDAYEVTDGLSELEA